MLNDRTTASTRTGNYAAFEEVPIQFSKPNFAHSLAIAHQANIYAYDAYVLDCAMRHKAPILTLDRKLIMTARDLKAAVLEV